MWTHCYWVVLFRCGGEGVPTKWNFSALTSTYFHSMSGPFHFLNKYFPTAQICPLLMCSIICWLKSFQWGGRHCYISKVHETEVECLQTQVSAFPGLFVFLYFRKCFFKHLKRIWHYHLKVNEERIRCRLFVIIWTEIILFVKGGPVKNSQLIKIDAANKTLCLS